MSHQNHHRQHQHHHQHGETARYVSYDTFGASSGMGVGSTDRIKPVGDKKARHEGISHWMSHVNSNDQRTESKDEKVPVKKNAEVPTGFQKNHAPEKAKKVLETTQSLRKA